MNMGAENTKLAVSESKVRAHVVRVTTAGGVLVARKDGVPVGTVGLGRQAPWYSDDTFVGDYWFYVLPEYRKSRAAASLKRAAIKLAHTAGLNLVLGVFSPVDTDRKNRFLARGGVSYGCSYMFERN
jgi:GNAT superfamily N-acetyltransferase